MSIATVWEAPKTRIEYAELSETYGKFIVEPLERGFGVTLGNAPRPPLLSAVPRAAGPSPRPPSRSGVNCSQLGRFRSPVAASSFTRGWSLPRTVGVITSPGFTW